MTDSLLHPATKREHHQPIFSTLLGREAAPARGFGRAPLETECRHRDAPPVVDPADNIIGAAPGTDEEHLAELCTTIDLANASHLDARLVKGAEQVRRVTARTRSMGSGHRPG